MQGVATSVTDGRKKSVSIGHGIATHAIRIQKEKGTRADVDLLADIYVAGHNGKRNVCRYIRNKDPRERASHQGSRMAGQGYFGDAAFRIDAHKTAGSVEVGIQFSEQITGSGQYVGGFMSFRRIGAAPAPELTHDHRAVGIVTFNVTHNQADLATRERMASYQSPPMPEATDSAGT